MMFAMPPDTDAVIETALGQVHRGDRQAFATVVRRFEHPLRAWFGSHVPPGVDVDDTAQATFIAAFTQLTEYTPNTNFATWLFFDRSVSVAD